MVAADGRWPGRRTAAKLQEPDPFLQIEGQRLDPGARLGIVGPSGYGKTLTPEALIGFRDAPPGRVFFGVSLWRALPIGWAVLDMSDRP